MSVVVIFAAVFMVFLGELREAHAADYDWSDLLTGTRSRWQSVLGRLDEAAQDATTPDLQRLKYNNPGLEVDLAVGLWAWPIPIDFDGDGDLDLVVSCPDTPYDGTYFFENPGVGGKFPVLRPARRISGGERNVMPSYVDSRVSVLLPGKQVKDFTRSGLEKTTKLPVRVNVHSTRVRANQWRYADYDADGRLDLIVGVGDWSEYGWDDAFDAQGRWNRGPLHGYVYLLRNLGTKAKAVYDKPVKIEADGKPVDVYGMPSPNLADFDGDGDLDLLCGEFVDKFTYFENVGSAAKPRYAAGRPLSHARRVIRMDLCMIVPVALDWDGDDDVDLIVGQEDGRVALVENTGKMDNGLPDFLPPRYFRQESDAVKVGVLATPCGFDWDGDGDEDIVCGTSAGHVALVENLDGGCPPRFAAPRLLEAEGRPIHIMAGENGSIQGPCESKWGYTTLTVADWDGDGLPDLVVNSIWGKVVWYRNVGTRRDPKLAASRPVEVEWLGKPPKPVWNWWEPEGRSLVTQWRTTPVAVDHNGDGLCDLVMLDHEGFLVLFQRAERDGRLVLLPPRRVFLADDGTPLRLTEGRAGRSGRRKICLVDWDRDGRTDLLVNGINVDFLRNEGQVGEKGRFVNRGPVAARRLSGHTTSPTVVDWDRDGLPDLVIGAEDGHLYYLPNPRAKASRVGGTRRNQSAAQITD